MASVAWIYPQDQLIVLRTTETGRARNTPLASGVDLTALNFGYRIDGDRPDWRPVRVFDDGRQIFIEFAERSEEHTSELQSLMRISYAVFCLKKKNNKHNIK